MGLACAVMRWNKHHGSCRTVTLKDTFTNKLHKYLSRIIRTAVQNLIYLLLVTYFRFHFSAQIHTSVGELHSGYDPVCTHYYFALIVTTYLGTILMFVYNLQLGEWTR